MAGEHDLKHLLSGMSPVLDPLTYVFVTLPGHSVPPGLDPRMTMQEGEGTTIIITRDAAQAAGLPYEFPCRMITLNVHSALDAVGFLAKVTTRLAGLGMGVNPVAGFYHDHLFIPAERAEDAMTALGEMVREARG
ncbi:ribonuclease H family protein [Pelagivirga sediminicola]|uniref:Ribonuclease H family protein n=1 Tax=Pelagivirga sediminicola TaxID=2170575 RepID=A0A2T7G7Q2_9RHOB|nr:ACT domain-containing protein [Pelagivirga sediminicola]PVA10442.1 ribonuclease H family protein [Pelagivirga sediminicola]